MRTVESETESTGRRRGRRATAALVTMAACLTTQVASGQDASTTVVGGARALAVSPTDDGVFVNVCPKGGACDPQGGQKLRPPTSFRGSAAKISVKALELEGGKEIAWVAFPGDEGRTFNLLLAPPKKGDAVWFALRSRERGQVESWLAANGWEAIVSEPAR